MRRLPNPIRLVILCIGLGLARLGVVDSDRVRRTVDLAWPRIITGLARMSKNAVDIAMVGVVLGPTAIAGVGFASPYWGLAFSLGGGLSTGTIALVSQRYGAEALDQVGQAVRSSVVLVLAVTLPIAVAMWAFPTELVSLLTNNSRSIEFGAAYLETVAFGIPFAGLNLVGSRILIGADDAWSPMIFRGGGAILNISLNAVLIFGFDMGVVGAALGTVLSNAIITVAFTVGLVAGWFPGIGSLPVTVPIRGEYFHFETLRDLVKISTPATARRLVWTGARFPMMAIVSLFGSSVVAAYVVSRQIWGLMNTPGWGFGLAASSLVGQSLGNDDEATAEAYGHEIMRISVMTYVFAAAIVFAFAEPIVVLFVDDATGDTVSVGVGLVYAACLSVIARGVDGTYAGALEATGDTQWPFYGRLIGMFGISIPLAFLGATTSLGLYGLYLSYLGQSLIPGLINYYRFKTGKWKRISRQYRPKPASADD